MSVGDNVYVDHSGLRCNFETLKSLFASSEECVDDSARMRTHMDLCYSWFSLVRQMSEKEIKILDLKPYEKEQITGLCIASKDNSRRTVVCLRNKYLESCPLLSLAMYTFMKLHVECDMNSMMINEQFDLLRKIMNSPIGRKIDFKRGYEYEYQWKDEDMIDETHNVPWDEACIEINSDEQQRLSGFQLGERYVVRRSQVDTPSEFLDRIFPINQFPEIANSEEGSLLLLLRKILCQDMVFVKIKYPNHPLSLHPVFNDNVFNNFVKEMQIIGLLNVSIDDPSHTCNPVIKAQESENAREVTNLKSDLEKITQERNSSLSITEKLESSYGEFFMRERSFLQHVEECADILSNIHLSLSRNMTVTFPPILDQTIGFTQLNRDDIHMIGEAVANLNVIIRNQKKLLHDFDVKKNFILDESMHKNARTRREVVMGTRLSRKATNIFEMWDDFKQVERNLEENGIPISEWLKLHGNPERQFRHTRLKIIKFIESEAERTHSSIETIKEQLHVKMTNRQKPWTLDEVQRKLTAGRRIDLS